MALALANGGALAERLAASPSIPGLGGALPLSDSSQYCSTMRRALMKTVGAAATAIGLSAAMSGPAFATTKVVHDKAGDAPAGYDITKVTYGNNGANLTAIVKVHHLSSHGKLLLVMDARGSEGTSSVNLDLKRTANGSLKKHFYTFSEVSTHRIPCHLRTSWNLKRNLISISIPRSCVVRAGFPVEVIDFKTELDDSSSGFDVTKRAVVRHS